MAAGGITNPGERVPGMPIPPGLRVVLRIWPWLAAALSGLLLAMTLPPWNQGWLVWIALTPLIAALWFSAPTKRQQRRQLLLGYVAGLIYFTVVFYWLSALGTLFAQPWLKSLPFLLSLILGCYFAFWAWFLGRIRTGAREEFLGSRGNLWTGLLGASAWVVHEWVRGWLFTGFGWNGLGVALHKDLALIQIADVTGVLGLSLLVAFCNLMAVIIVRRLIAELGPLFLKRIRWEFSLTAAIVVAVFAYGVRTVFSHERKPRPSNGIAITAIQPNIPQSDKFSREAEDEILGSLDSLTALAATTQTDLMLWPESAVPRGMYADEANYRFVWKQVEEGKFSLLLGTVDGNEREAFNTAALLTKGMEPQIHRKIHLVPFGEYLPFRDTIPLFALVAGDLVPGDFTAGKEFTVMTLPSKQLRFSALICFEDTLGDLTRRFVLNGAELLVNITNDGWFLQTAGAEQHVANAIFRAVENRRPLIRCTNTGVTCSVDEMGRVDRWLAPFGRGFAKRRIAVPERGHTFYTRNGDWLAWVCIGIVVCPFVFSRIRRRL